MTLLMPRVETQWSSCPSSICGDYMGLHDPASTAFRIYKLFVFSTSSSSAV